MSGLWLCLDCQVNNRQPAIAETDQRRAEDAQRLARYQLVGLGKVVVTLYKDAKRMCLYFDSDSQDKTKLLRKSKTKVIRYKNLAPKYVWNEKLGRAVLTNRWQTPYMNETISKLDLVSDRSSTNLTSKELDYDAIDHGIHVYSTLEKAKERACGNRKTFLVECDPKDLVMVSEFDQEEVYTKVKFLPKQGLFTAKADKKKVSKVTKKGNDMVKWTEVMQEVGSSVVQDFAYKAFSKDMFLQYASGTSQYTNLRRLVRERGVNEVRQLARKALKRRGI